MNYPDDCRGLDAYYRDGDKHDRAESLHADAIETVQSYGDLNIALCKLIEYGFAVLRMVRSDPLAETGRKLIEAGIQAQCFPLVAASNIESGADELREIVEVAFNDADGDYSIAILKEQLEYINQSIEEMAFKASNWKEVAEDHLDMDSYWQKPELIWKK